jgi:dTDP-4-amino-4,6-dideoxygalactose transaminase
MNIPFFPYSQLYEKDKDNYINIFDDVCSRGAYILQKDLDQFESRAKTFLGVKHAFGVANGTDALIIGLKALGIGKGDEVIVPSHTYIASAASIYLVGAKVVLCECGPDGMMDPNDIEHRITSNTKAIMPVHINGRVCNMDMISKIAKKNRLLIVEDAAQAFGAKYKNQCAGTFGEFGTISFYPAKVLGCFGDGGLIMTNNDEHAKKIFLLRDHGRDASGEVVDWGLNSRLDNLQAAILLHKLKTYKSDIKRRRRIAKMYSKGLSDISAIQLPPSPEFDDINFDIYQNFELRAKSRDELRNFLDEKGIGTIIQWAGTPVHKFKKLGFRDIKLPFTETYFKECLMLPMNMGINDDEIDYVISSIRDFYG